MINRCEYCRQLTDGMECRKCGAPLPVAMAPYYVRVIDPRDFSVGSTATVLECTQPVSDEAAKQYEEAKIMGTKAALDKMMQMEWKLPGGTIDVPSGCSVMVLEDNQPALANYGRQTEIDKAFPYPAWIRRSLINWRIRDGSR